MLLEVEDIEVIGEADDGKAAVTAVDRLAPDGTSARGVLSVGSFVERDSGLPLRAPGQAWRRRKDM